MHASSVSAPGRSGPCGVSFRPAREPVVAPLGLLPGGPEPRVDRTDAPRGGRAALEGRGLLLRAAGAARRRGGFPGLRLERGDLRRIRPPGGCRNAGGAAPRGSTIPHSSRERRGGGGRCRCAGLRAGERGVRRPVCHGGPPLHRARVGRLSSRRVGPGRSRGGHRCSRSPRQAGGRPSASRRGPRCGLVAGGNSAPRDGGSPRRVGLRRGDGRDPGRRPRFVRPAPALLDARRISRAVRSRLGPAPGAARTWRGWPARRRGASRGMGASSDAASSRGEPGSASSAAPSLSLAFSRTAVVLREPIVTTGVRGLPLLLGVAGLVAVRRPPSRRRLGPSPSRRSARRPRVRLEDGVLDRPCLPLCPARGGLVAPGGRMAPRNEDSARRGPDPSDPGGPPRRRSRSSSRRSSFSRASSSSTGRPGRRWRARPAGGSRLARRESSSRSSLAHLTRVGVKDRDLVVLPEAGALGFLLEREKPAPFRAGPSWSRRRSRRPRPCGGSGSGTPDACRRRLPADARIRSRGLRSRVRDRDRRTPRARLRRRGAVLGGRDDGGRSAAPLNLPPAASVSLRHGARERRSGKGLSERDVGSP